MKIWDPSKSASNDPELPINVNSDLLEEILGVSRCTYYQFTSFCFLMYGPNPTCFSIFSPFVNT